MDSLPRDLLATALNGNPRVVNYFENALASVSDTAELASTNAAATDALQDATYLTLSSNTALTAERVLKRGTGIRTDDDGTFLTIRVNDEVPHVQGGFPIYITALGATNIVVPLEGILATRDQTETLQKKTLNAPSLSGIGNYANDAAAAAGGVPIGGVYRNGSQLMLRIT